MSSSYTGTSLWLPVHHRRCRVCSAPHPDYLQDYPHRQEFMSLEPRGVAPSSPCWWELGTHQGPPGLSGGSQGGQWGGASGGALCTQR